MGISRPGKTHYTEHEAAAELGVDVHEFRSLVKQHILDGEAQVTALSRISIYPSDLLVLRLLARRQEEATAQD